LEWTADSNEYLGPHVYVVTSAPVRKARKSSAKKAAKKRVVSAETRKKISDALRNKKRKRQDILTYQPTSVIGEIEAVPAA
jgi:hypothetical protein